MEKKGKILGLDIIRIIACISVYTHHYLRMELEPAKAGFEAFRRSAVYKYMFGIFGAEYAVIAFFIIAGFFMSYKSGSKPSEPSAYVKKCAYRCMNIIIPSFIVITVTAVISLPMKALHMAEIFSFKDYFYDVFKLIIGIPGDKHIHYAYPLWFQHFIFAGYISGYAFLYIFRNNRKARMAAYLPVLIYLLFNSEYTFMIFMGMLAGDLCAGKCEVRLRKIFKNRIINVLALIMLSAVMSYIMKDNYDSPIIYGPAALCFAIFVLIVYCMSGPEGEKKNVMIDFLSSNSYSCYLTHFFLICSVMRIVYRISLKIPGLWQNDILGCSVLYIFMTVILWIAGFVFTKYVLTPLKRFYDRIWDRISTGLSAMQKEK